MQQLGIGPNATSQVASTAPVAAIPMYNNALDAEMGRKRKSRAKGCRTVKGGGCLCNGRFSRKSRCRR